MSVFVSSVERVISCAREVLLAVDSCSTVVCSQFNKMRLGRLAPVAVAEAAAVYYMAMYSSASPSVCLLNMLAEFPGRRREHVPHYCLAPITEQQDQPARQRDHPPTSPPPVFRSSPLRINLPVINPIKKYDKTIAVF